MRLLAAGSPRPDGTELERDAAELAELMTRLDRARDEEVFARLRRELTDEQLVELAAWISLQGFYSSFNAALGIDADPPA